MARLFIYRAAGHLSQIPMKYSVVVAFLLLAGTVFGFSLVGRAETMPPVTISELMWMGSSITSSDEWIELKNTTDVPIDLSGWKLNKLSSGKEVAMVTISSGTVPAGGFFLIAHFGMDASRLAVTPDLVSTSVSLVNSKLQISLYDSSGILVDRADDGIGNPAAGEYTSGAVWHSMERNTNGYDGTKPESWHDASVSLNFDDALKEFGTPVAENSNLPPVIALNLLENAVVNSVVQFDASETVDPESDSITFRWDFGDGTTADGATPTHAYIKAGTYTVRSTASDGKAESFVEKSIVITAEPSAPVPPTNTNTSTPTPTGTTTPTPKIKPSTTTSTFTPQASKALRISEVLPNPDGSDTDGEFIEIVNTGKSQVNLRGWSVTNKRTTYAFDRDFVLDAGENAALYRPVTRITLRNSGEEYVALVDPWKKTISSIRWKKSSSGESYSRDAHNHWHWVTPTPDERNKGKEVMSKKEKGNSSNSADTPKAYQKVTIQKALMLPRRTDVAVNGTVIAEPGMLGDNLFYISDGSTGMQVTSTQGSVPDVQLGQTVSVQGSIGSTQGEPKVNLAAEDSLTAVTSGTLPVPAMISSNTPNGSLAVVEGTVQQKRSGSLWIETSTGTQRVTPASSSGIDLADIQKGDAVKITGIWRVNSAGKRLYPRMQEDIVQKGKVAGATTDTPQVVSAPSEAKTLPVWLNIAAPLFVLAAGAGIWWWRKKWVA